MNRPDMNLSRNPAAGRTPSPVGFHGRRAPRVASVVGTACAAALLLVAGGASAAGDIERGQEKSTTCAACHGAEGIATAPQWPVLAGQYRDYIEQALHAYRSGKRQNAIMQGFASQLSDEDIEDLAAYFHSRGETSLHTAPRADSNN